MKEPRKTTKNGREVWLVDLRSVGGGRQYFQEESAARRAWAGALKDKKRYGELAFQLSAKERTRYLALETRLADLGTTLEAVVDHWERSHRSAHQKAIGEAIEACLKAKLEAGRRPRTLEQLRYSLESLRDAVGPETPVGDITHEDVERWLANPKWSLRSRHGKLVDAGTFFNFAIRRGWCASNCTTAVERVTLDAPAPGILTPQQVRTLLTVCQRDERALLPFLVLGTFAGIRPSGLRQMRWNWVHLDQGHVEVPAEIAKGRQRRLITLQPSARAWLALGGLLPPTNWRRRWIRVRQAAGFAVERGDRGIPWPHDAMRHSFCSYAVPVFGAAKTAEWAGHSEQMLFKHYRELVTEASAREFWSIVPK